MNWVSSDGCIGSWCWSWPTSSFRKSSFPICVLSLAGLVITTPFRDTAGLVALVVFVVLTAIRASLREHVHQHAVGQLEGRGGHGVGRVGAGSAGPRSARGSAAVAVAVLGARSAGCRLVTGLADVEVQEI